MPRNDQNAETKKEEIKAAAEAAAGKAQEAARQAREKAGNTPNPRASWAMNMPRPPATRPAGCTVAVRTGRIRSPLMPRITMTICRRRCAATRLRRLALPPASAFWSAC